MVKREGREYTFAAVNFAICETVILLSLLAVPCSSIRTFPYEYYMRSSFLRSALDVSSISINCSWLRARFFGRRADGNPFLSLI